MSATSESQKQSSRGRNVVIAIFVALFLLVVLVAQLTSGNDENKVPRGAAVSEQGPSDQATVPPYQDSSFVLRDPADPAAVGAVDAPVVMTVWTDFRCPFCAVFNQNTLPELMRDYVDTGKVRVEVQDVAFFGEESQAASVAARAAGQQGKFFDYMSALYAEAPEKGHPAMPRTKLIDFAREAAVADMEAFTRALDDPALIEQAQAATRAAQQAGVTGVPFFVAGGTSLSGAQPAEVFRSFLDATLAATPSKP